MPDEPVVAVAAGLLAIKPGARYYYHSLCRHTNGHLVTPHGAGLGPSSETYRHFEAELDELSAGSKPLVIIGHSLGAIQAVRYAASHDNVISLMLIGIPGDGSALCHLVAPWLSFIERFAPVITDLTPQSAFLAEMKALLPLVTDRITCVYARFDLVVWPAQSCYIEDARRYLYLPWATHVTMINDPKVLAEAGFLIEEARQACASPRVLALAASL